MTRAFPADRPPSTLPTAASGVRAVVVGSGPNGLAAALTLARAGARVEVLEARPSIGGGTRTEELTLPGLRHDLCSAFHPTAAISPFLASLNLEAHGLRWARAPVDLAHVLEGGRTAALHRDLDRTAAGLGIDGEAWARLFGPLAERLDDLVSDVFGPVLRWPGHPVTLARFGLPALLPATVLARRWREPQARALFAGMAAHAIGSLHRPLSSAAGLLLTAATHRAGMPVAVGGSAAISAAMAALLSDLGGSIHTGIEVDSLAMLDDRGEADLILLDLAPRAALRLLGERMPSRIARSYRRFRRGPGAFKVDFAVRDGVPWVDPDARRAGTVHVGGTLEQIAAAEEAVVRGRMPTAPFILVGQQYLADPSRSAADLHPVWAYAHVPHGYRGDVGALIEARIEAFAPGFGDRVVARHVRTVADLERDNANYVGGDIAIGASDGLQAVFRPRATPWPYATGVPGVYLCSAATPPGPGVHGMCGFRAAEAALRHLGGDRSSDAENSRRYIVDTSR